MMNAMPDRPTRSRLREAIPAVTDRPVPSRSASNSEDGTAIAALTAVQRFLVPSECGPEGTPALTAGDQLPLTAEAPVIA
jgi:hypothetical protein